MNTPFHSLRRIVLPVIAASLALSLPQFAGAQDTAAALFPDPTVAKGRGFEIKRSTLDDVYINYKAQMALQGRDIPESERLSLQSNILEHLVVNKILAQNATPGEKAAARAFADKEIADYRQAAPSEEIFQAHVKATGMTLEQLRAAAEEKQLGKTVLIRELVSSNTISDAAIKQFYDTHSTNFALPEQIHVAHILISTLDPLTHQPLPPAQKKEKENLAKEVRAKAANGEDFAKLAKQYSDDDGSKNEGGEITFARGTTRIPEVEAAAFSLKTNQISDVVETQFGYHIVKLLEKLPPSLMPLAKVIPDIRDYLANQEIDKQLPAYVPKLEAEYNVQLFDLQNPDAPPKPAAAPGPAPK